MSTKSQRAKLAASKLWKQTLRDLDTHGRRKKFARRIFHELFIVYQTDPRVGELPFIEQVVDEFGSSSPQGLSFWESAARVCTEDDPDPYDFDDD